MKAAVFYGTGSIEVADVRLPVICYRALTTMLRTSPVIYSVSMPFR